MSDNLTCTVGGGPSILRSATGTRVCGLQTTTNSTLLEACCGDNAVQDYGCSQYCETESSMRDFAQCLSNASSSDSIQYLGPFCQGGLVGNTTDQIQAMEGSGIRTAGAFWLKTLSWCLILSLFLTAEAANVRPASNLIVRRQNSSPESCSIELGQNFTTVNNVSTAVSSRFTCGDDLCPMSVPITLDPFKNNRTINGVSAADPDCDAFFSQLETTTGRQFPAAGGFQLQYDFLGIQGQAFYLAFTPFAWCVMATTNCSAAVGDAGGSQEVQACGPSLVSDYENGEGEGGDTIQGVIGVVITT